MTEEWMYQYPSTSVKTIHKGDTTLAERYHGDANKLLYELKNGMKFNRLGMNKMTRIFTDGTVITAKSHFGHDIIEIDVTQLVKVECTITLIDLPDAIPPMKYAGEIHAGEVEGIDYIKTYYTKDIANCVECDDNPDFTICTTVDLVADETKCIPFTFEDTTIESKEGEPNNHCLEPSEHCQAEVISFGQDGGGTYFIWKAYTEWPPDEANGYGFMQMKGFFKLEGKLDNECETIPVVIEVNCCEKNSDEYKTVHMTDWGDLDIEYTLLVMGCDEKQTLTAKYGCPPFVWTLVSGSGILTPAEDGLTALYESPVTNPNCSNPTIKLEDRCESSKELKLAVNCYTGGDAIEYVEATICRPCTKNPTFCDMKLIVGSWSYDCSGIFVGAGFWGGPSDDDYITTYSCLDPDIAESLNCGSVECWEFEGTCGGNCEEYYTNYWTGHSVGWHDVRSQSLKDEGCCPINPLTGLPYD